MVAVRRAKTGAKSAAISSTSLRPPVASSRLARIFVNVGAAAVTAFFTLASLQFYFNTHRLIGVGFVIEQAWFVVAFLVRRPARLVTRRTTDWLLAIGGSIGGTAFRPTGLHPVWGVWSGTVLQACGLILGIAALAVLGRSFGVAPADRGLVTRGPYAIVRHPIYSSYLLVQCGYLLQSLSLLNAAVFVLTGACNVGRALAEERLLTDCGGNLHYDTYRAFVRWRLVPGVW